MKTLIAVILLAFTITTTSCSKKNCHKPDSKGKHECSHSNEQSSSASKN